MTHRLVLLHGWGADADDLKPLGEALGRLHHATLDVVALNAPEPHPQGFGRQWYGLFPAQWDAVPSAVHALRQRLLALDGGETALGQTVLFGFSQGGAMALDAGCHLPLAGVISCSGYPHPEWNPGNSHPPVLLLHGDQDSVVPPAALGSIGEKLQESRCESVMFRDDHSIPEEVMPRIHQALTRMLPKQSPR